MNLWSLLVLLVIAAICGGLGQALAGYSFGGCLASIIVGFAGAWVGTWIAGQFNLPTLFVISVNGEPFPVVWAVIGSAVVAIVLGVLSRRP
jgi:uncharacterized membrane protein YeaQ/YmgE (transglycosylase-associated protein family)